MRLPWFLERSDLEWVASRYGPVEIYRVGAVRYFCSRALLLESAFLLGMPCLCILRWCKPYEMKKSNYEWAGLYSSATSLEDARGVLSFEDVRSNC